MGGGYPHPLGQGHRDYPHVQSFRQWMGEAVIIIDATRPTGVDFPEKNEVPAEAIEAVLKKKLI